MTDPYTSSARLCDDDGLVSDERVPAGDPGTEFDPELTYRKLLNNLRAYTGLPPYEGEPFHCTGSVHLAGEHMRCTGPAHVRAMHAALVESGVRTDPYDRTDIVLTGVGAERAAQILLRRGMAVSHPGG